MAFLRPPFVLSGARQSRSMNAHYLPCKSSIAQREQAGALGGQTGSTWRADGGHLEGRWGALGGQMGGTWRAERHRLAANGSRIRFIWSCEPPSPTLVFTNVNIKSHQHQEPGRAS